MMGERKGTQGVRGCCVGAVAALEPKRSGEAATTHHNQPRTDSNFFSAGGMRCSLTDIAWCVRLRGAAAWILLHVLDDGPLLAGRAIRRRRLRLDDWEIGKNDQLNCGVRCVGWLCHGLHFMRVWGNPMANGRVCPSRKRQEVRPLAS